MILDTIKDFISSIKANQKSLLIGLAIGSISTAILMLILSGFLDKSAPKVPTATSPRSDATSAPLSTTTDIAISVTNKKSEHSPDLELNQTYVANINGKEVEVKVKDNEQPKTPAASAGATASISTTATVSQTIDLTPFVDAMRPDWELGVGIGRNDSKTYIPVSLQRNYKYDRALQFEIHLDAHDRSVKGFEVQHKWSF